MYYIFNDNQINVKVFFRKAIHMHDRNKNLAKTCRGITAFG